MSVRSTHTRLLVALTLTLGLGLVAGSCGGGGGGGGGGGSNVSAPPPPGSPPPGSPPPPPAPSFNFSFPRPGTSNSYTFDAPGDWGYFCLKHGIDGMTGTVHVRESSTVDSALVQVGIAPTGQRYGPDTVTVKVGGKVRWVNVSTETDHTATRL